MRMMLRTHIDAIEGSKAIKSGALQKAIGAFIEKFKRNRVIVLTTHSMEEADILGDQIAIMALGKLR